MNFKRLDHIAFRVAELEPVVDFYTKTLGFQVVQQMEMDFRGTKAISTVLNLTGTPFFIFVDQGLDWDNIITKWVKTYGSGLHHMAYLVDDIETTWQVMMKQGLKFTTDKIIDTGGGLKQLFSEPNPVTGILTEIIQREKDDVFFVQENVVKLIESTEGL